MKSYIHCPLCYEELSVVETTPCISCGASETSLKIFKQDFKDDSTHRKVEYSIYRAFEELEVVLCKLCTFDFSSVDPEFFGLERKRTINPSDFQFLNAIEKPAVEKDKFCSSCNMRLAYLLFIEQVRELTNGN